jgi:hypothetical protein
MASSLLRGDDDRYGDRHRDDRYEDDRYKRRRRFDLSKFFDYLYAASRKERRRIVWIIPVPE